MVGLKMAKYSGSGWHFQTTRHSNARKYGKAGGKYLTIKAKTPMRASHLFDRLQEKGVNDMFLYNWGEGKRVAIKDTKRNRRKVENLEGIKKNYGYPSLQYVPIPKGLMDANNFPIQVSTIVPSTVKHNKPRIALSSQYIQQGQRLSDLSLEEVRSILDHPQTYGIIPETKEGRKEYAKVEAREKQILKAVEQAKKGKNYGKTKGNIVHIEKYKGEWVIYRDDGARNFSQLWGKKGKTPTMEEVKKFIHKNYGDDAIIKRVYQ